VRQRVPELHATLAELFDLIMDPRNGVHASFNVSSDGCIPANDGRLTPPREEEHADDQSSRGEGRPGDDLEEGGHS
jgi:hypothetical protein